MREAVRYIRTSYMEDLSFEAAAAHVNISPACFLKNSSLLQTLVIRNIL